MPILFQDIDFIVEQNFFGFRFRVVDRHSGRSIKVTGPLHERMNYAWHKVRNSKSVDRATTRLAEDLLMHAFAVAALSPGSVQYSEFVDQDPSILAAKMIDAASIQRSGGFRQGPDGDVVFSNSRFAMRLAPPEQVSVLDRKDNQMTMRTLDEVEEVLQMIDSLQFMSHLSAADRDLARLKALDLFCQKVQGGMAASRAFGGDPVDDMFNIVRGDFDHLISDP